MIIMIPRIIMMIKVSYRCVSHQVDHPMINKGELAVHGVPEQKEDDNNDNNNNICIDNNDADYESAWTEMINNNDNSNIYIGSNA